ncbi:DciA family protein [Pseudoduganella chitinolytica]|uniref:DciA family protein n=1 Tax=Pseudoduganella chitinolytica TaxID=34070 RepID=A0ABY8B4N3_9BURK|nr:DciA family protein [Pseudoduganella chitinolytica]WEF30917.1 DciA family protein [Pseudoduganella chitinolytica]
MVLPRAPRCTRAPGCDMFAPMRFNSPNQNRNAVEATDFLRRDGRMAALLPAVQRMAKLQQDCAAVLPTAFSFCEILAFEDSVLVLSTPNASVAAKLKQQLPKLQEALARKGWQVDNIKLKVQMMRTMSVAPVEPRKLVIPEVGVDSFAELSETLEPTKQNAALIEALRKLVAHRR